MANKLKMPTIDTIQRLHKAGLSNREIARRTGVHRQTVARYLAVAESISKSSKAPPGSEASNGASPPSDPGTETPAPPEHAISERGGHSNCRAYAEEIESGLERGLSLKRIHQDLTDRLGEAAPSYYSVRRFANRLNQRRELPFRRIETDPGEEAQIDFGTGAPVLDADGKRRRPWVFRIVLSYSRKAYSEAVYHQSTEAFITALENAFHYFGGVPRTLVPDNLKAAVTQADWYDPEIHRRLFAMSKHYGTVILPTKPYTPRHKGKIENGVKYVKDNALKGRMFKSLVEENDFLRYWEQHIADTRIHGTTKRQVGRMFEKEERGALLPLPRDRFPFFHESRRKVHRDGHVEIAKAYYSVPPEYVGREVWCRWDGRLVWIFNSRWERIALHTRAEKGRMCTDRRHIPPEKVSAVERGADYLLDMVGLIGPHTRKWSEAMLQARGVAGMRVLVGLRSLAGNHETAVLEDACRRALAHGTYRLRSIRELIKRGPTPEQTQFDFLEEHPIIRPLSDYSVESLDAFRRERT